jgi:hypothetical protein
MTKSGIISLRVEGETKTRIANAAARKGVTMTTFIIQAAEREAVRVEKQTRKTGQHTGVPTFFRALCREATHGGTSNYGRAGYELTRHIGSRQMPSDVDDDEWHVELERLASFACPTTESQGTVSMVGDPDVVGVWQWFCNHYPKCMKLIPIRRKRAFVEGVRAVIDDDNVDF